MNLNERQLLINLSLLWNCHTSFRRKLWDNERPIRFIYSRVLRYLIWQGWWHPGHLHHKLRLSPRSTHSFWPSRCESWLGRTSLYIFNLSGRSCILHYLSNQIQNRKCKYLNAGGFSKHILNAWSTFPEPCGLVLRKQFLNQLCSNIKKIKIIVLVRFAIIRSVGCRQINCQQNHRDNTRIQKLRVAINGSVKLKQETLRHLLTCF